MKNSDDDRLVPRTESVTPDPYSVQRVEEPTMSKSEWSRSKGPGHEFDRSEIFARADDAVRGKRRSFTEDDQSITTYNWPVILRKFSEASGESLFDTVCLMLWEGMVRFEWDPANLERAAEKYRVTLATANHEITESGDTAIDVYSKVTDRP